MTLGNAAAAHVRLIVWCRECQHQVEPDPAEHARRYGAEARPAHADLSRRSASPQVDNLGIVFRQRLGRKTPPCKQLKDPLSQSELIGNGSNGARARRLKRIQSSVRRSRWRSSRDRARDRGPALGQQAGGLALSDGKLGRCSAGMGPAALVPRTRRLFLLAAELALGAPRLRTRGRCSLGPNRALERHFRGICRPQSRGFSGSSSREKAGLAPINQSGAVTKSLGRRPFYPVQREKSGRLARARAQALADGKMNGR